MRRCLPLIAALLTVLPTAASANYWVVRHITLRDGGASISTNGTDSVGGVPNHTTLTEYSSGPQPKKLNELDVAGHHLDAVMVKPDRSEVIGHSTSPDGNGKWIVYNFKRIQDESRSTTLSPAPGYEIVDVRYVDGKVTMLSRRGDNEFNAYQMPATADQKQWTQTFRTTTGDLSGLVGFPNASSAAYAMDVAATLPFVDMMRATPKADFKWWDFFGGRGSSDLAGFDAKSGIIAVRSTWGKDDVLEIARATPNRKLATIKLAKPGFLRNISVVDGLTFIVKGNESIEAYDQAGKLVWTGNGVTVVGA